MAKSQRELDEEADREYLKEQERLDRQEEEKAAKTKGKVKDEVKEEPRVRVLPTSPPNPATPHTEVGVDLSASGSYTYVEAPNWNNDRTIDVEMDGPPDKDGKPTKVHQTFEHVDTDKDGRWLYRYLG